MQKNFYKRVYILGSVASGKTTMAQKISRLYGIPCYELDNVVYSGDRKNSENERNRIFKEIINGENWVIEGVYRKCFDEGFEKADIIIILDTPAHIRKFRIIKRWICQKLKIENSNYAPTLKMLMCMYKWSKGFEKSKVHIMDTLKPYMNKVIVTVNNSNLQLLYKSQ